MPQVKMLHGRMAGMVQEVPVHALENLLMTGQAEVVESTPAAFHPKGRKAPKDARVTATESDAAGEIVKQEENKPAAPVDDIATRATDGRPEEPRRPAGLSRESIKGRKGRGK